MELARSRGADGELAGRLEEIATRAKDLDALGVAHEEGLIADEALQPPTDEKLAEAA